MEAKRCPVLRTVVSILSLYAALPAVFAGGFEVFDGTAYVGKPDMSAYGVKPVTIIYAAKFWPEGKGMDRLPLKVNVLNAASDADRRGALTVLDVEQWPLSRVSGDQVEINLFMYQTILEWFREGAPRLQVGYYGRTPIGDNSRAILWPGDPRYMDWQRENDRIGALAEKVDVLYPSLYTAKPDQEGWVKVAVANIKEARRLANGKPVYVFLWPLYDDNPATEKNMVHTYVGNDFWTLQLKTAKVYADGAIIWGGWDLKKNKAMIWDDSAPWWKDTKEFMKSGDLTLPAVPTSLKSH
jgi:hypothetical protein